MRLLGLITCFLYYLSFKRGLSLKETEWAAKIIFHNWALTQENLSSGYANNKGADQPAHPRSLISAFDNHVLKSISKLATAYSTASSVTQGYPIPLHCIHSLMKGVKGNALPCVVQVDFPFSSKAM